MRAYSSGVRPCRSSVGAIEGRAHRATACSAPLLRQRLHDRLEQHAARPRCRPRLRTRARDAASGRRRCAPRCRCRRCCGAIRSGSPASVGSPARVRVAEDRRARSPRAPRARPAARSSCPRRARSAAAAPGRRAQRAVNGVSVLLDAHADELAVELDVAIAEHRARQQPALEQNLKAVADAEHRAAGRRRTSVTAAMIGENRAIAPVRR